MSTTPITKEGAANQFLNTVNELKSDGDPDKPATANEKMSMFFTDLGGVGGQNTLKLHKRLVLKGLLSYKFSWMIREE